MPALRGGSQSSRKAGRHAIWKEALLRLHAQVASPSGKAVFVYASRAKQLVTLELCLQPGAMAGAAVAVLQSGKLLRQAPQHVLRNGPSCQSAMPFSLLAVGSTQALCSVCALGPSALAPSLPCRLMSGQEADCLALVDLPLAAGGSFTFSAIDSSLLATALPISLVTKVSLPRRGRCSRAAPCRCAFFPLQGTPPGSCPRSPSLPLAVPLQFALTTSG